MRKIYITLFILFAVSFNAGAQAIEKILESIEQNNLQLQALKKSNEAALIQIKSENSLENTSVEYSPFFRSGVNGVASSEMVVRQGFDFPTLYAARNKSGKMKQTVLDLDYQTTRRDILLEAKLLCHTIIYNNKARLLVAQRKQYSDSLLILFNKRLAEGDATLIDVNKIKIDCMNIDKEFAELEAEYLSALKALKALNGNIAVDSTLNQYDIVSANLNEEELFARVMESDYQIMLAEASEDAMAQEVKVVKQNWIPKIELGYRRNTDGEGSSNGFLVGASMPIFSNSKNVKIAKAQHESAKMELSNAKIEAENRVRAEIGVACALRNTLDCYDTDIMYNTLDLLFKAVEAGEISIIEYYTESDSIFENLHGYLQSEKGFYDSVAVLLKNDL